MEIEDLQFQNENLASTVETQSAEIARLKSENERLAVATPAPSAEGMTAEQIKDLQEKAAKAEEATARANQLQGTMDQTALEKEFPAIKDWTAVKGDTLEDRRAHAEQINKMIGVAPGTPAPTVEGEVEVKPGTPVVSDTGNPGDAFGNVPPAGTPSVDKLTAEETLKNQAELREHQKKGNLPGVLDSIFKMNPNKTKALFGS